MMTHSADDSGFDQPSLDELISLREAAELSGLSASHLRHLVSRGDIWGVELGRVTAPPGYPSPDCVCAWIK